MGNLYPSERTAFLARVREQMGPSDRLLLGMDLVKDPAVLEAAYNDAAGVTAEFNLNLLRALNEQLGADFDVDAFEHVAFFDTEESWIEMRLRSLREQRVSVAGLEAGFAAGEEMRTEISCKFRPEEIESSLGSAGLRLCELFTDDEGLFALALAAPE